MFVPNLRKFHHRIPEIMSTRKGQTLSNLISSSLKMFLKYCMQNNEPKEMTISSALVTWVAYYQISMLAWVPTLSLNVIPCYSYPNPNQSSIFMPTFNQLHQGMYIKIAESSQK